MDDDSDASSVLSSPPRLAPQPSGDGPPAGPAAKRPRFRTGTPAPLCCQATGALGDGAAPPEAVFAKLQKVSVGSMDYHIQASGLLPGPGSLQEIASWPLSVLDMLWTGPGGRAKKQRCVALLQAGVVLHSDCSGKLSPEAVFHIMVRAMDERQAPLPKDSVVCWRACDTSPACQRYILGNRKLRPVHLFDGLLGKLEQRDQASVAALRPKPDDADESRAEAFDKIDNYLQRNASRMYNRSARAKNCVLHPGKACLLSWQDPEGIPESKRPLTVAIAGTPCRPWTRYAANKRGAGAAHNDMEVFHLWKNEIRCQNYDLVFFENCDHFLPQMFASAFPAKYLVKYGVWGAHEQGWPMRRRRFFAVAINMCSLLWLGNPEIDLSAELLGTIGRSVKLEADVFAKLDTPDAIARYKQDMAKVRGFYPNKEQALELDVSELLPHGQRQCYESMKSKYDDGFHKIGLGGGYVCDVSQQAYRARDGAIMPTIARTSQIISVSSNHLYTPAEVDFAMGWPNIVVQGCNEVFQAACGMDSIEADLTDWDKRSLSGNGMVLPQLAAWMWYIFGYIGKRAAYQKLMPPLYDGFDGKRVESDSDDDDDIDDFLH